MYDVIIVGGGPAGIYNAYEFMLKAPHLKVLLIEKGYDIYNRKCPSFGSTRKMSVDREYVGCHPAVQLPLVLLDPIIQMV